MAHLICKSHNRRVMVLPQTVIHRTGDPCDESAMFLFGDKRFTAAGIRDHGKLSDVEPVTYKTKTGKVLTTADVEKLADEAEQGHDPAKITVRPKKETK